MTDLFILALLIGFSLFLWGFLLLCASLMEN
jgi:hypothetical protein